MSKTLDQSEYMTIPEAAKVLGLTYEQMYRRVQDNRILSRYMPRRRKGRGKSTQIMVWSATVEIWKEVQDKERKLRVKRERVYKKQREERQAKIEIKRGIFEGLFPGHTIEMNSPAMVTIDGEVTVSESGIFGPYLVSCEPLNFVHEEELLEVVEMLLKFRKRKRARGPLTDPPYQV